jgi:hypothetical protein
MQSKTILHRAGLNLKAVLQAESDLLDFEDLITISLIQRLLSRPDDFAAFDGVVFGFLLAPENPRLNPLNGYSTQPT